MKYIKKHPMKFAVLFVITAIYIIMNVQGFHDWLWSAIYILLVIGVFLALFITSSEEEELTGQLDQEVKRLNMSREKLYQVTGYNRYEVTENEKGETIFWIPLGKKKALLKKLRTMENGRYN